MTNADKIRAMTDEELACKIFTFLCVCTGCPAKKDCLYERIDKYDNCVDYIADWLKQEVTDNG